jgi:hypothetical protein
VAGLGVSGGQLIARWCRMRRDSRSYAGRRDLRSRGSDQQGHQLELLHPAELGVHDPQRGGAPADLLVARAPFTEGGASRTPLVSDFELSTFGSSHEPIQTLLESRAVIGSVCLKGSPGAVTVR